MNRKQYIQEWFLKADHDLLAAQKEAVGCWLLAIGFVKKQLAIGYIKMQLVINFWLLTIRILFYIS